MDLIELIDVSLITILVVITGAYGFFTWEIVDDQRKSRQIAFIERRLEKLYYPIKDVLSNPITINYSSQAVPKHPDFMTICRSPQPTLIQSKIFSL